MCFICKKIYTNFIKLIKLNFKKQIKNATKQTQCDKKYI